MQIKGLVDKIDSKAKDAITSWMDKVNSDKFKDCLKK